MIIGISGKIGSGKDTIGSIIQYLTLSDYSTIRTNMISFEKCNSIDLIQSNWQIKKFAGKVKEVCSILTGIPVEDFEKEEVKNSKLSDEWIRYGYADGFIKDMDGNPTMINKQCDKETYKHHKRINWQTAYKHHYTVRELMQLVGTDAIRKVIHENAWVNALFADYKSYEYQKSLEDAPTGFNIYKVGESILTKYPNWIITDVRFPNEYNAIKERDGIIIRVNRPKVKFKGVRQLPSSLDNSNIHPSETSLDNHKFDYVIDNDSTIDELIEQVKEILINEKII